MNIADTLNFDYKFDSKDITFFLCFSLNLLNHSYEYLKTYINEGFVRACFTIQMT